MDDVRFDQVARSLQHVAPRRVALGVLLGSALGLAGLAKIEAKKGKGKGKKGKKRKGKTERCAKVSRACGAGGCDMTQSCCLDSDCNFCRHAICITNDDPQDVGVCGCAPGHDFLNGACGQKPECLPAGSVRSSQFDIRCCSGSQDMVSDVCLPGVLSCLSNSDCSGGLCRGYSCEAQMLECSL